MIDEQAARPWYQTPGGLEAPVAGRWEVLEASTLSLVRVVVGRRVTPRRGECARFVQQP